MDIVAVNTYREELIHKVKSVLNDLLFTHRSYLRPAQIHQLAQAEINLLLDYLKSRDESRIRPHAAERARTGMNIQALLRILAAVDTFFYQNLDDDSFSKIAAAIGQYRDLYLECFIEARESVILLEQERIRAALQGSLTRYNLWLQTATEVSRAATSTLDLRQLITNSVEIIRSNFNLHNVGLFLLDADGTHAVLRASSGEKDPLRAADGIRVAIDERSCVGWCIIHAEAKVISSVQPSQYESDQSLLPHTQSVMALPLISRRQVIGAILIQSVHASAFYDDDITRLQTVADQLANAIQNARLYYELQVHSQDLARAVQARTVELQKTKERVEAILNNSPDAILLLNKEGQIELCNPAFFEMFGYEMAEIAGKPLDNLTDPTKSNLLTELFQKCLESGQARNTGIVAQRKDRSLFDAGVALAAIHQREAINGFVCTVRDITDQVQANERIKDSLREKEVLLQEIHHRVKNNMQVISSLLALQAGYISDEQVDQMFQESQNRIRSMALVHEQLYRSQDLARIDVANYTQELTANLMRSYRTAAGRISLEVISDPIHFDIDMAIPCGLIINELVSNSLKHAFPNGRNGHIVVELRVDSNGQYTLIVRDDGVGFPETLNVYRTETLGLQLVASLTAQLSGTIGLQQDHGTTFEIRFAGKKDKRIRSGRTKTSQLV